jgi:type VI secretion system protein ImpG
MGRLREKIDDDLNLPKVVSMLWPHYLRTIPSLGGGVHACASGREDGGSHARGSGSVLPPGGPKNTVCRYRTTRDVMLNPLNISGVTMTTEPDGRSLLRMRFALAAQADWSHADLSHLSLYLGADAPVSSQLHLMLTRRQAALYMRLPGQTDRIRLDGYFSPGGFAEEDGLWPKGDTAFSGYQLLLEYFTFRDKFMFVHLNGLDGITPPAGQSTSTSKWCSVRCGHQTCRSPMTRFVCTACR